MTQPEQIVSAFMYYSPASTPNAALGQTNFVLILTPRFLFLVSSFRLLVGFSSYFLCSGCQTYYIRICYFFHVQNRPRPLYRVKDTNYSAMLKSCYSL